MTHEEYFAKRDQRNHWRYMYSLTEDFETARDLFNEFQALSLECIAHEQEYPDIKEHYRFKAPPWPMATDCCKSMFYTHFVGENESVRRSICCKCDNMTTLHYLTVEEYNANLGTRRTKEEFEELWLEGTGPYVAERLITAK